MLTWNVTYHCKPGKREEFFKAISAHCQTEIFARLQALKTEFCENVTIDKFGD